MTYDVVMLVRNSMTHDSRVDKEASYLAKHGLRVVVLAHTAPNVPREEQRQHYNIERLPHSTLHYYFQVLLKIRKFQPRFIHAHDLDTLVPATFAARLVRAKLIYDSHELWLERNHAAVGFYRIWDRIKYGSLERLFIGLADHVVTVSEGVADELHSRYPIVRPLVLRNLPVQPQGSQKTIRHQLQHHGPIFVFTGGITRRRGLEELVATIPYFPEALWVFIGPADNTYVAELFQLAKNLGVAKQLCVLPPLPHYELASWLREADVGLCLISGHCLNYRLSLPNKFFDFAFAGVPILVSDFPEMRTWVRRYNLGTTCADAAPPAIAHALRHILDHRDAFLSGAAHQEFLDTFCWEREVQKLAWLYPTLPAPHNLPPTITPLAS